MSCMLNRPPSSLIARRSPAIPGLVETSGRAVDRIPGSGGPGISVAVRDRGEGIAPEHISRLTERFYRVDKGRSRALGGTGLGLAIVKHIVNRHRGRLVIESEPGEGSVFTVLLPRNADSAGDRHTTVMEQS